MRGACRRTLPTASSRGEGGTTTRIALLLASRCRNIMIHRTAGRSSLSSLGLGVEAEVRFIADLAEGNLMAEPVVAGDWLRIARLVAQYRVLPLGAADASVIAAVERLDIITEIATLDRRHFTLARPSHGPFRLLS